MQKYRFFGEIWKICVIFILQGYVLIDKNMHYTCMRVAMYSAYVLGLDYTLSHHGVGYFDEACHVGALHVVDVAIGAGAILHA